MWDVSVFILSMLSTTSTFLFVLSLTAHACLAQFPGTYCQLSPPEARVDCGSLHINKAECTQRGCCYDGTVSGHVFCFYPTVTGLESIGCFEGRPEDVMNVTQVFDGSPDCITQCFDAGYFEVGLTEDKCYCGYLRNGLRQKSVACDSCNGNRNVTCGKDTSSLQIYRHRVCPSGTYHWNCTKACNCGIGKTCTWSGACNYGTTGGTTGNTDMPGNGPTGTAGGQGQEEGDKICLAPWIIYLIGCLGGLLLIIIIVLSVCMRVVLHRRRSNDEAKGEAAGLDDSFEEGQSCPDELSTADGTIANGSALSEGSVSTLRPSKGKTAEAMQSYYNVP